MLRDKRHVTPADKRNTPHSFGHRCVLCGADLSAAPAGLLHVDHWIPRSHLLGLMFEEYRDRYWNLVCMCKECNLKKGVKVPEFDHPLTIRFILQSIAEDAIKNWELDTPIQHIDEKRKFWIENPSLERQWALIRMNNYKVNTIRRILNEQYREQTNHHYIADTILFTDTVEDIILNYKCDLPFLAKALRMAMSMHRKEMMHLDPKYNRRLAELVIFREWPDMCAMHARGATPKPLPYWERYPFDESELRG